MNTWIIADTHFNHTKLEEWGGRSGAWQEKIWQGIYDIPRGDILIHLGDICIGNEQGIHLTWVVATVGLHTILVRGNHDKKSLQWYMEHGFDFACDGIELLFHGHYLHLTHRPARPQGNTSWNIHGHTHGNIHRSEEYVTYYDKNYHIDVSPEIVGYTPVRLDALLKTYKQTV